MSNPSATSSLSGTGNTYNVSDEVFAEAKRLKLELIATGGGSDFVFRKSSGWANNTQHEIVLQDAITGDSPKTLKQTANLVVFFDSGWTDNLELQFPSCELALQKMGEAAFLLKLAELVHDVKTKRTVMGYWASSLADIHHCKVVNIQLS